MVVPQIKMFAIKPRQKKRRNGNQVQVKRSRQLQIDDSIKLFKWNYAREKTLKKKKQFL